MTMTKHLKWKVAIQPLFEEVSSRLGRTWIGIDKSDEAIKASIEKLSKKQKNRVK